MAKRRKRTNKPARIVRAQSPKLPNATDVAKLLGMTVTKRLSTDQIQRLRKPLPGYVGLLDDAAKQLARDADLLNLPDVTPEALLLAQVRQKYLAAREAVAETVFRAIYEQRLQMDDHAMA